MGQTTACFKFDPRVESALMKRFARVVLLTLLIQLSSVGHWSIGPFHRTTGELSVHTLHCHGDSSGCGGQPSLVGTLDGVNLTPAAPLPWHSEAERAGLVPLDPDLPTPHGPPRV